MPAHAAKSTVEPHFLMCRPQHFKVSYSINPWMDPQAWASADCALGKSAEWQWNKLHQALTTNGAAIEFLNPKPDLPDLVFTANAAVVLDGTALLSRFRHPQRQREEPIFAAAFRNLQIRFKIDSLAEMPKNIVLEGAGDCIWDQRRHHFWMGYGQRSDRAAAEIVTDTFGVECIALELVDPKFYHLDTALSALPTGDLIYYPEAFSLAAGRVIAERVDPLQRIELQHHDAMSFAANAVSVDHCLVLSSCTESLRRRLDERGLIVVITPLETFIRSGGSACCLTLRLDYRSQIDVGYGEGSQAEA